MSRVNKVAVGAVLSLLVLAGCGTNSRIPEIRDASFNRAALPTATDATHEVRLGETLYSIAWRYNMDYHDLARWNDIQPPYAVRAGQKLRLSAPSAASTAKAVEVKPLSSGDSMSVPANSEDDSWLVSSPTKSATGTDVQPTKNAGNGSDTPAPAAKTAPNTSDDALPAAPVVPVAKPAESPSTSTATPTDKTSPSAPTSPKATDSSTQTASTAWLWPTKGTVVGHFSDPSAITAGLDIAGQKGQPVLASRSGTVVYAGNSVRGYGNLVIIKHDEHFLSAYAHNDVLKVRTNETVKAGQMIATMGDTDADRSKLHFEIRQDSQAKDPQQFLPRS